MAYNIYAPQNWSNRNQLKNGFNVFSLLIENYKDEDILFKIIKNNGNIKNLTKSECVHNSKILASSINELTKNNKKEKQLKILAIISASEESSIFMLASSYLAAHHCICFEDLSKEAITKRIELFNPDIILCRENLEEKAKSAATNSSILDLPVLSFSLPFSNFKLQEDINYLSNSSYKDDSNLFTLFTSGSTGLPKAIVHGVDKYLDYSKFSTEYFFGISRGSTIFTAVDAGWINGHTYSFYGPLLLGSVSIINENKNLISIPRLLVSYLSKIQPDCFYTSVTLLRLLKSLIPENKTLEDFSENQVKINRIGSCGEPLAHNVGEWAVRFFNPTRKTIVNTYFQTETGGVLVAPRDEDGVPSDYSCVGKPRTELGLHVASNLLSNEEMKIEGIVPDEILIKNHWNGIFKKVISDKPSNYFTKSGYFRLHDVGYFDKEGFLYIGGRSDDVINVSGHRISSSEVESICISLDDVNEACAVSVHDNISGSKVALYFSSKTYDQSQFKMLESKIKKFLLTKLSIYHVPERIHFFEDLPKTQSGKIMRRIMKDLANNLNFNETKDYSTLANKEAFLKSKASYLNSLTN